MRIEYYALVELKVSKYYGALAMLNVWNPRDKVRQLQNNFDKSIKYLP